jgi:hypothetical protein
LLVRFTKYKQSFYNLALDFEFTLSEGTYVFLWVSEAFGFNLDEFVVVNATASGIETNLKIDKISIYPNPFNKELFIVTNAESIELYNLVGQIMNLKIDTIDNGFRINTDNLQQGVYFIKAENTLQKVVKK